MEPGKEHRQGTSRQEEGVGVGPGCDQEGLSRHRGARCFISIFSVLDERAAGPFRLLSGVRSEVLDLLVESLGPERARRDVMSQLGMTLLEHPGVQGAMDVREAVGFAAPGL